MNVAEAVDLGLRFRDGSEEIRAPLTGFLGVRVEYPSRRTMGDCYVRSLLDGEVAAVVASVLEAPGGILPRGTRRVGARIHFQACPIVEGEDMRPFI